MCTINICISNIYSLVPLVSCFFVIGLGIFVFLKNTKRRLNQLFLVFSFVVGVWLFGTFMMFNATTDSDAIAWDRFIYAGVVFVTTLLYHIGIVFTNNFLNKKWSLYFAYASSFFFLIASRSDYFISGLYKYSWGVHAKAQILHHPFLVIFYGYFLWFLFDLVRYYKNESSLIKREQVKYLLLGCAMLILISTPAYLPAYNISVFPFAFLSGVVFSVILGYAITKYYLMDIRVLIKRSTSFLILFSFLMGLCSFGMFFLSMKISNFWAAFVCSFIVILGFLPFKNFLENITDKVFLSKKYKFDQALSELLLTVSSTIDIKSLLGNFEKKLVDILKVGKVKVLVFNGEHELEKTFLYSHLKKHSLEIIDSGFLEFFIDHNAYHSNNDILKIKKDLDKTGFQIAAPIFFQNEVTGILFLESKISGDSFYFSDINLIRAAVKYLGAAIENAKLYEKANKLIKDLSVANKAKSDFINVTSHQFRTPLSTIRWYSENIIGDLDGTRSKNSKFAEFIKIIHERTVFLINVLNSIFSALEIEGGSSGLQKKEVFLWEIMGGIIEEFKDFSFSKKIDVVFEKEKIFLGEISVDAEKIKEVLRILINNSINYSSPNNKVFVLVSEVVVNGKGYCRICVKDFGIGINKKDQELIFNKFFRAGNAISLVPNGIGLGLFISKNIIEKHGGRIWVESELGKGSEFYIDLPV